MRTFFAVLLAAAPAFATFHCPAKGGAQWSEYRSAHFIVDTDQGASDARDLVKQLEHFHALILQALVGEQVDIPGHLRVLAFSDQTDFAEMASDRNLAAYFTFGVLDEPTIVMPVRGARERPELVAHELAHYLSRYLFPVQPAWFAEGLAEFVQTAARRPGDTAMTSVGSHLARGAGALGQVVGSVPLDLVSWIAYDERPLPATEVLGWKGREQSESPRGHLYGWLLYHWLRNQRSKAFAQYEKVLGDGADPQAAWSAAFPEFDPKNQAAMAKLDDALEQYRRHGQFAYYKVEAKDDDVLTSVAPLAPADLHMWMLNARNWGGSADERKAIAAATVNEAFAEDPGNPAVWFAHAEKFKLEDLRKVVQQRPGDWRGWYRLGNSASGPEAEAALRRAVELNPDAASALNNLAWMLANANRPKEALPFANRALDLRPWQANTVDTLAEIAARLGQCPQALQLEQRAVRTAFDPKPLAQRQAALEARCAAKK